MGLKEKLRKLTAPVEELEQARIQDRCAVLNLTPIDAAELRTPIRVGGEIQKVQIVPRAGSPSLEVTVSDGHGKAIGVFTGRSRIAGVTIGRNVVFEGVARKERDRLVVLNPAYTLVG
ncbi:MAG: hypothetical protein ACRD29_23605 [Acidimicrobiales bacterium]